MIYICCIYRAILAYLQVKVEINRAKRIISSTNFMFCLELNYIIKLNYSGCKSQKCKIRKYL